MPRPGRTRQSAGNQKKEPQKTLFLSGAVVCGLFLLAIYVIGFTPLFAVQYSRADYEASAATSTKTIIPLPKPVLNTSDYDHRVLMNANYSSTTATSTRLKWPVKTVYPNAEPLLPYHRIIAYYGNFYSTKMGVLGEYSKPVMLQKLHAELDKWNAAGSDNSCHSCF
jgi:hypothetical protein